MCASVIHLKLKKVGNTYIMCFHVCNINILLWSRIQLLCIVICTSFLTQEEQTIAARTRSKLSLQDTSIIELESTFVPPDFTPDMYDTGQCEDEDWQGFLQSLYKPPGNNFVDVLIEVHI